MNDYLGVRHFAENEINLRLYHREIAMRAALQDVFPTDLLQVVHATRVDPDVKRQDRAQACENFFRLPSLALLIDDVALQKHSASHRQSRHRHRLERAIGHLTHRDIETLRDSLQECTVSR